MSEPLAPNQDRIVEEFAKIPEVQMIIHGESDQGETVFVLCTMPTFNLEAWDRLMEAQMNIMRLNDQDDQEIWYNFMFLPIEWVDQPPGEVWFDRKAVPHE